MSAFAEERAAGPIEKLSLDGAGSRPGVGMGVLQQNRRAWQALRDRVIREEPHCWLGYDGCTGRSTTGDHVVPVSLRPDLALVRSNVRGACAHCNKSRQARLLTTSAPKALRVFD